MRALLLLAGVVLLFTGTGCLWGKKKPKDGSHVYGGNAPSIIFSEEQERAGGAVRTY